ncbi:hypothetical protein GAO09_29010 [Rhizobiales bacterium RZME27]|uniref:Uncharacterized protein n=1 Tax=Endobacterium cereale TaxID=2663029 RepID=A0A6A8AFH5_9HYPH|nr:hypothetical protein [Endobacterium cereale]MQY50075.1 hypothetical protein [Endobacterium cereale]
MADRKEVHKTNWLIIAFNASGIYIAGFMVWIILSAPTTFFTDPKPNEVGDFLAGLFAPVAFILLACAVVMQRQELKVTREELADNREVVAEQLKQIRIQTAMLADQQRKAEESAKQTYKLNLFDKRFDIYNALLTVGQGIEKRGLVVANDAILLAVLTSQASFVFPERVELFLVKVCDVIADNLHDHGEWRDTWTQDEFGSFQEPTGPDADAAKANLGWQLKAIIGALSYNGLRQEMWSSMRVSDA